MKITLINHSDTLGGASVVTRRLAQALRQEGIDARMVVGTKSTDLPWVAEGGGRAAKKAAFLAEHAEIFANNGFNRADLFKVSTCRFGADIASHPWVREADAVCLNWVNQGLLSLRGISDMARGGRPLIWTMHDMWNLTGICHHAGPCRRHTEGCGHCPLLHSRAGAGDLSRRTWLRKAALLREVPVTFVAVSQWLAEKCRASALLRDADVRVIPNAFPVEEFAGAPRFTRADLRLPDGDLIAMGAARLDDPVKGLSYAIEAFNILAERGVRATAVLFGAIRQPELLHCIKLPWLHLGMLTPDKVHSVYAHSRAVLSSSLYETLPGTLIEGQAAGCIPVSFGQGGQGDIIDHGRTGFIADYLSARSLADNLVAALGCDISPDTLHSSVAAKFSAQSVARKYLDLIGAKS